MKALILFLVICTKSESAPFNNYSLINNQVKRVGESRFQLNNPTLEDEIILTLNKVDNVFVDNVEHVIAVEGGEDEEGVHETQGVIVNDHFIGHLTINDELFYIEPADKYNLGTGGVMYKAEDVTEKQNYAREKLNFKKTNHTENYKDAKADNAILVSEALRMKKGGGGGNICMMEITIDKFLFCKLGNE